MINEDDANEFLQQLSANYGQIESVLGTDGYAEFLRTREAERAYMNARGDYIRAIANTLRIFGLIGMLCAMPVIVWLWKWAI